MAAVLFVAAGIPLANARGGHGGGGYGGWHGGGGWHDGGHFHGNIGFYWGGPLWYPYYWSPYYYDYGYYYPAPYYYDYPPAYDYNTQTYYPDTPRYSSDTSTPQNPGSDGRDYLTLGHDAGKALQLKTVSNDWLREYLRFYVVNAPASAQDDFRRGFISGYGEDGESVYKKAVQDAGRQAPPPPPRTDAPSVPNTTATPKQGMD